MAATSDPPPGSVTAIAVSFSPRQIAGRYFSFSASLPVQYRWGEAMSVCTPTAMAREAERERAISSQSTAVVRKSAPLPPYFSSYSTPRKPSAPIRGQMAFGIRPACSHSSTCGATSFSTNARTAWRNISCCSLKIFIRVSAARLVPLALVRDFLGAVGDRAGRDDFHGGAQLHGLTEGSRERGGGRTRLGVGAELDAEREDVVVALAGDDGLRAAHARDAGCRLVHLARVDEHAAHLGHLVHAAAPPEHAGRGPAAGARARVDDREVAGGEADHRVALVPDGGHDLAELPVGQRPPALRIAHLQDRVVGEVHAGAFRALVGDHAEIGGPEALARHDAVLLLQDAPHRLRERLGSDLGHLEWQRAGAHFLRALEDR